MEYVYRLLENERDKIINAIEGCSDLEHKAALIGNKNLVESSIKMLRKCERYDVNPSSIFTKLPDQVCQSPSSEYRVIEDCETDNPQNWVEIKIDSKPHGNVRLGPGDVVIEV